LLISNKKEATVIGDEYPNLQFIHAMEGHVRQAMGIDDVLSKPLVLGNKEALMASKGMLGHVDTRFV
jgi:hypothetical protein